MKKNWFQKIIEVLSSLFGGKKVSSTPVKIDPQPEHPESENFFIPKDRPMTREELNSLDTLILEGKIQVPPYTDYPYVKLREDAGKKNRNKWIDLLIGRQGGSLGNAYCQFGQQDDIDALAKATGIDRKFWLYPEGGSTQTVFGTVKSRFITTVAKAMCLWTVQYNGKWEGHIERVKKVVTQAVAGATTVGDKLLMFGFNTDIDGDDAIARDGQGAGYVTRKFFKEVKVKENHVVSKGFVDLYLIYLEAYEAHKAHNS